MVPYQHAFFLSEMCAEGSCHTGTRLGGGGGFREAHIAYLLRGVQEMTEGVRKLYTSRYEKGKSGKCLASRTVRPQTRPNSYTCTNTPGPGNCPLCHEGFYKTQKFMLVFLLLLGPVGAAVHVVISVRLGGSHSIARWENNSAKPISTPNKSQPPAKCPHSSVWHRSCPKDTRGHQELSGLRHELSASWRYWVGLEDQITNMNNHISAKDRKIRLR